ncbi:hypothetical protein LJC74_05795 [Eubacteriales bacterium OttesenSCG-928-A19]|nr:hypothetical protein [Eubacteriales bacterium OttesenSCG-928-A19]
MSILADLTAIIEGLGLPVETGVFRKKAPDEYVVVTPILDTYELWADNQPQYDVEASRISIFSKGNYQQRKRQIEKALLAADFNIDERRYIGREDDTGYHHYVIDVEKAYTTGEEDDSWQPSV